MKIRHYLIFLGLTIFPVAHFLLQDYPNTEFYLAILSLSLICIALFKHHYKDRVFPFDFDEGLNFKKWGWIGLGTLLIYGVTAVFSGISLPTGEFTPIVVPTFDYSINYFNTYQLPTYMNDILFNITLVAPAEELCKLASMISIFIFLAAYRLSKKARYAASVGLPVSFWSLLHVYSNPVYIVTPLFVVSAFIAGIILVFVLWKTKSILAAILVHGFYNSIVVFLRSQGMSAYAMSEAVAAIATALQAISSTIVDGIVNFISAASGGAIMIPPWAVQLVLLGLLLFSFWRWAKRLPWVILAAMALAFVALLFGFFSI